MDADETNKIILARYPKFKRESDGKIFSVTFLGHWSDIKSEDGETDTVKWLGGTDKTGGEEFISASKGHKYIKMGL